MTESPVKVRWKRQADGSWRAIGLPIIVPARITRDQPIIVRVPQERSGMWADGWHWAKVVGVYNTGTEQGEFWALRDAKAFVEENLDLVLRQANPEYDGDPEVNAEHAKRSVDEWRTQQDAYEAQRARDAAENAAPLSGIEQALVDALAALSGPRYDRILTDARKARA